MKKHKLSRQPISSESGNGVTIYGTFILICVLAFLYALLSLFVLNRGGGSLQVSADCIADSVAVYMASDGGDYGEALEMAQQYASELTKRTGARIDTVSLDPDDFENNIISVTLTSGIRTTTVSIGTMSAVTRENTVARSASTLFTGTADIRERLVTYAMMWVGVTPYCGTAYDNYRAVPSLTEGCDCSQFVYLIYKQFNILCQQGPAYYFSRATWSKTGMQPGDVLVYGKIGDYSTWHVALYAGNGMIVNNGGGSDGTQRATYTTMYYRNDLLGYVNLLG